jgi:hypothetical protein
LNLYSQSLSDKSFSANHQAISAAALFIEVFNDSFCTCSDSPVVTFTVVGTWPSIERIHLLLHFAPAIIKPGFIAAIDTIVAIVDIRLVTV